MAQGSTRFEHLEKSVDDYIIEQQKIEHLEKVSWRLYYRAAKQKYKS